MLIIKVLNFINLSLLRIEHLNFPTKNTLRNSGILFASIIFILFYGLHYFIHNESRKYVLISCLIIIAISLISPYSLRKPYLY